MIYSTSCSYAIRALTYMAMVRPDGYVLVDELCEAANLPRHFLAKILQDLARKHLLISAKGRGGGFALGRPARQISLYDIVECIDGVEFLGKCAVAMAECNDRQPCPQHEKWEEIRGEIRHYLRTATLDKLGESLEHKLEAIGADLPHVESVSKPLRR